MTIGDVYWVAMPARGGHAQAGRRPAIIFQTAAVSSKILTVLIVPLTSQQDALRFPGTVLVEPDKTNGLRQISVALVFQLTAVDRNLILGQLGRITPALLTQIRASLDEITGRP